MSSAASTAGIAAAPSSARAPDGAAAIPAVLAALQAHGVTATSVTVARPSLDDVYLRHAGRAFHQGEAGYEEVAA